MIYKKTILRVLLVLCFSFQLLHGGQSDSIVTFNEIMYHPEVDEANLEWVELYNQMAVNIDMSEWSIRGGIDYDFPEGTMIPADGYIVVAVSPSALEAATGYAGAYGPFDKRLSNDGEELRLRNNNKRVMDIVDYRDDGKWPVAPDGFGVSLAKYNQLSTSEKPENWRESIYIGGTPGEVNFQSTSAYIPEYDTLLTGEDPVKLLVPNDASADSEWQEINFDDTGWMDAITSIGFTPSGAYAINEDFSGLSLPSNMEERLAAGSAVNYSIASATWGVNDGRGYIRTIKSDYNTIDFVFEATAEIKDGANPDGTSFFGLGSGVRDGSHYDEPLAPHVFADIGPDGFAGGFFRTRDNHVASGLQGQGAGWDGVHRLRLTWTAVTGNALFEVDQDYNGTTFTVDYSYTEDGSDNGFDGTNAHLFFGGGEGVIWDDVSIQGSSDFVATDIETDMSGVNATVYVRMPFTVDDPLQYDELTLGMQYDDGFVAYLNGTKVLERNAPVSVSWNSNATTERANGEAVQFEINDISQYIPLLETGQNVLAVHGLNLSASDEDFLIASQLNARHMQITAEGSSSLVINEISAAGTVPFLVELYNYGPEAVSLDGYRLRSSGVGEINLSGIINADGYISIDTSGQGFVSKLGDKLFLYAQGVNSITDAVVIKSRLKGHLPGELDTPLQYPSRATFGSVNSFDLHDEIIINEIMYHYRPEYATTGDPPSYVTNTLVEFDHSWKYNQLGNDLGTSWKESLYDDSGWPSGPGVLGKESAPLTEPIQTPLTVSSKITYYFRTDFEYTGDLQDVTLQLKTLIDDGAIFYLNGVDIYRTSNMPAGNIDYLTLSGTIGNAALADPFTVPHGSLVSGTNVLAVEVHQTSDGSSDIVFGMEMNIRENENLGTSGTPYAEIEEEWIELYNHSNQTVDISGWKLDEAIDYEFPQGTNMAAGEYLVVAKDTLSLQAQYPAIRILGDYAGKLSDDNERIMLLDANENTADTVHYYSDGKWPKSADGGGASLELRDPLADNTKGQAWAGSDEVSRSPWRHYTYTAVATAHRYDPPIYFHELVLGMLDSGEILLDNVSVIENPDTGPVEFMQNLDFEGDVIGQWPDKWRIQGTHDRSVVDVDPDNPNNKVLRLIADGPLNYLGNHAETTLANGQTVVNGNTYKISFDAKWISGSPQLRTELYYCDVAKTNIIEMPLVSGTPGYVNSIYETNIGPTYSGLRHEPLIPDSEDTVTISINADDPDGVTVMTLWYAVDDGSWNSMTMSDNGDGLYTAQLPPQNNGAVVQFYIAGEDSYNVQSFYPADGPDSRALYMVVNGFVPDPLRRDFRFFMTPTEADFLYLDTNLISNQRIGTTVIYNNQEVFYNVRARLKGSINSRNSAAGKGFNVKFHADQLFRGVHESVTLRPNTRSAMLPMHLVQRTGGISGYYLDVVDLTSPLGISDGLAALSMARYGDIFLESQFDNGKDGTTFKLEGNRYMLKNRPTEGLKVYIPYGWISELDIADYGDDKEKSRWVIKINRNRSKDDYARIIDICKAFSLSGTALQNAVDEVMDVDVWMRQFAMTSLCGIVDTYSYAASWGYGPHNLMFYIRPSDNKVVSMPWDWDINCNQDGSTNRALWGSKNVAETIELPVYNRLFLGHMHDIASTSFSSSYLTQWGNHYSQISEFSFNTKQIWLGNRASYVLSQMPTFIPFEITTNGGLDFSVDDDAATLQGRGWINVREIYLNDAKDPLDVEWQDNENWQVTIPLEFGANIFNLTVHDFRGNIIATDSITVTSTVDELPLRDNLRVTELMYDPAGDSNFEFIELYNAGTNAIDISSVNLIEVGGEGVVFDFAGSAISILSPNEYILIVNDLADFSSRYDTSGLNIAGEYSGKLSNSGEKITIRGKWNAEVLSFYYADSRGWPLAADGVGHSLVPLNSAIETQSTGSLDYGGNWRASTYIHGSPGKADPVETVTVVLNEIMAHTDYDDPPYDSNDWIELFNVTGSQISFSTGNWYLSDDKDQLMKWVIPATTVPAYGFLCFDEVTGFHNPITQGFGLDKAGEQVYLSYLPGTFEDRVVDCVKFKSQENNVSLGRFPDGAPFWYSTAPSQNSANLQPTDHVVINEFMYNPPLDGYEYIELYNPGLTPVALWESHLAAGWRFDGGVSFAFDQADAIPAGGYLLIAGFDPNQANIELFETVYNNVPAVIAGQFDGSLSNKCERIALEKPQASDDPLKPNDISWVIVDEVIYFDQGPWFWQTDGWGKSLQRKSILSCGNDSAAWHVATPTPGVTVGDINADGIIDLLDFAEFSNSWMSQSSDINWEPRAEFQEIPNGIVDYEDMMKLLENWLSSSLP